MKNTTDHTSIAELRKAIGLDEPTKTADAPLPEPESTPASA